MCLPPSVARPWTSPNTFCWRIGRPLIRHLGTSNGATGMGLLAASEPCLRATTLPRISLRRGAKARVCSPPHDPVLARRPCDISSRAAATVGTWCAALYAVCRCLAAPLRSTNVFIIRVRVVTQTTLNRACASNLHTQRCLETAPAFNWHGRGPKGAAVGVRRQPTVAQP